ncbi:MAG: serine hydrolase [Gemmatimonadota bacterium]
MAPPTCLAGRRPSFSFSTRSAALILLAACAPPPGERTPVIAETAVTASSTLADSLASWYALGLNAHHLCAGLWVVGRDHSRTAEAVIAEDISRFPAFRWGADYTFGVDEARHVATVSQPGIGSRSARYSGDQGCAILPEGNERVAFTPVALPVLPDPSTQQWPTGDRNAEGSFPEVDQERLDRALLRAFDDPALEVPQNTRGLVVVYRGKIVAERYTEGWGPYTPQLSWSMGKSIAAALTGVMVASGAYGLDDRPPIALWEGELDPRREIRVRDLLHMSSGLDFDNFGLLPDRSYTAANEHFRIYFDAVDVAVHSMDQPLRFPPGQVWRYRNSDPLNLMAAARAVLEDRGEDWLTFPTRTLFQRIGMRSMVLETDVYGNFIITGFDYGGSRDWARFGLLHLQDGVWNGERILPEGWTDFVSTPAPGDPSEGYGGLFWLNRGGTLSRVPADAYWAAGYMGQRAMIIPSRDVVIVRQGPSPSAFDPYFNDVVGDILDAIGTR